MVGDQTYGAKLNKKLQALTHYEAPRVMLHAYELTFVHPRTKKSMSFQAPLPPDFKQALKILQSGEAATGHPVRRGRRGPSGESLR